MWFINTCDIKQKINIGTHKAIIAINNYKCVFKNQLN
jgi:hypothetical protein